MSPITFTNSEPTPLTRVVTGLHSLDLAFSDHRGNIGLPLRCTFELYGYTGSGKSTLAWTLAGKVAKKIALADLEGFDPDYMKVILDTAGFDGEVAVLQNESDEKLLDSFEKYIINEEYQAAILDSVGAINPVAELESATGERNMGQRSRLMAQASRRYVHHLRFKKNPSIVFMINHVLQIIGGRGSSTSGGDVMKYLASMRVRISKQEPDDFGNFIIEGKIEKNRYGIQGEKFQVYYLSGRGIHQGLTAANDCIYLGLASNERVIKMDGISYGYWKKLVERADDPNIFKLFIDKLQTIGEVKHEPLTEPN